MTKGQAWILIALVVIAIFLYMGWNYNNNQSQAARVSACHAVCIDQFDAQTPSAPETLTQEQACFSACNAQF